MKKLNFLFLAFIVFLMICNPEFSTAQDSLKSKRIILKTSLTEHPMLSLNAVNINCGAEIFLKKNKSVEFNAGYLMSPDRNGGFLTSQLQDTKGFQGQMEVKHYFNRRKIFQPAILIFWPHIFQYKTQNLANAGYYIASGVQFQKSETEREETIADNSAFPGSGDYKKNNYFIERDVYSLHLKLGYQCIKTYGLTIDYAVGLGAQYIKTDESNKISMHEDPMDQMERIYPKLIYQVKLGWAL
ncbi:MAG: DUF3575 domain-containing protein [Bacteroidota bacterium]|nr:DUF3575 domain-containing protein [Bacteroidota bacterium]